MVPENLAIFLKRELSLTNSKGVILTETLPYIGPKIRV